MYEIGRTELTYSYEDAERKGWERNESIIVFHVPEEEYNLLKDKSLSEIRDYLEKECGMHDGSDYYVQPGARYTDYMVEAIYEVGWDGQLIVREIEALNV